jgi:MFS family permease
MQVVCRLSQQAWAQQHGTWSTECFLLPPQLMVTIGILVAQLINYGTQHHSWGWRVSLAIAFIPAFILFWGAFAQPRRVVVIARWWQAGHLTAHTALLLQPNVAVVSTHSAAAHGCRSASRSVAAWYPLPGRQQRLQGPPGQ